MKQEILKGIPDKREDKNTTSLKFKEDLIDFFGEKKLKKCMEIGTNRGYGTYILSHLFDEVVTFEMEQRFIDYAKNVSKDRTNIQFIKKNVYIDDWGINGKFDVSFIDCVHTYDAVQIDIKNSLKYDVDYLLFDDYGLFPDIKKSVDNWIEINNPTEVIYIGEPKGSSPRVGKVLLDWEGIIIKI